MTRQRYLAHQSVRVAGNAEYRQLNGREHVVGEATLVKGGMVLKDGLLPQEELENGTAAAFSGVPIPVGHPEENGNFTTANDPQTIERDVIGRVWNTELQGNELKGELWLDVEKAGTLANKRGDEYVEPVQALENGDPLSVSTAYFYSRENKSGTTPDGERYEFIQRDLKPDHLAALPRAEGECGLEDGCGYQPQAANAALAANCGGGCDCGTDQTALANAAIALAEKTDPSPLEWYEHAIVNGLSVSGLRSVRSEFVAEERAFAESAANLQGPAANDRPDNPTHNDWAEIASDLAGDH